MKSSIEMISAVRSIVVCLSAKAVGKNEAAVYNEMIRLCDDLRLAMIIGDNAAVARLFPLFCMVATVIIHR